MKIQLKVQVFIGCFWHPGLVMDTPALDLAQL